MQPGEIGILNVGAGDTKLSFDPSDPKEVKRAGEVVTDMIRRGYAILVEAGRDEKGPLYRRALDFDPETAEYIIAGDPPAIEKEPTTDEQEPTIPSPRRRKAKATRERVPASRSKAVSVAPIAGG